MARRPSTASPPQPKATSELEELLEDARIVARYGRRAGMLPDSGLMDALQAVREKPKVEWHDAAVLKLQEELNRAVAAIRPVTLVDLRRGWDPHKLLPKREFRTVHFVRYLHVALALVLIVTAVHYSQWLKRAEAIVRIQEEDIVGQLDEVIHDIYDQYLVADGLNAQSTANRADTAPQLMDKLRYARTLAEARWTAFVEYNTVIDQFFRLPAVVLELDPTRLWVAYDEYALLRDVEQTGPPTQIDLYACDLSVKNEVLRNAETAPPTLATGTVGFKSDGSLAATKALREILADETRANAMLRCAVGADPQLGGMEYDEAGLNQKIETVSLWLLPSIFGAFGAVVYHLRACWNRLRPDPRLGRAILRIFLGAFGGIGFGWFLNPSGEAGILPPTLPLGAYAMAFLIGYSIDIFFALLDRLVNIVAQSVERIGSSQPSQPASGSS